MARSISLLLGLLSFHAGIAQTNPVPFKPPVIASASDEAQLAIQHFKVRPGFQLQLFAAEPLLAHPVAFAVDEHNRIFVSESFRVGEQVTDIRKHMNWLDEELASTNTAQLRQLIRKYIDRGNFMTSETERIQLLEDSDNDGKADKSTVFAEGFNDIDSGIASGVLARKGEVWFTCIPHLWRLRDTNNDGTADQRESLQHGYGVRFGFYGHDLHGLRFGPDGKIYFSIGDRGLNVVTAEGRRVAEPECGAVLRCNPDGTGLELFATGLRNPQELAFDEYGNLFTGDNNSDGGDQARWVYLVEGGDSGWRVGYQFLTWPVPRGPWNEERMWHPQNEDQPAFLLPPITNLVKGPSGLTYSPGVGLPPELDRHFFLADFLGFGAMSSVYSFALRPHGASFEVVDQQPFVTGILVTDVDFGIDGAIYISDWVEGWGKTGKGRIYRAFNPQHGADPLVAKTRQLMAQGFSSRPLEELSQLLSFRDQRVRQEAQFEMAARGIESIEPLSAIAAKSTHQLARLHAIWGLGQIASKLPHAEQRARILKTVSTSLTDADPEVQAQAAKVVGEAKYAPARAELSKLAVDLNRPRVQFFAVMALGKIGGKEATPAVLEMLRQNRDQDPYLRHAGAMALYSNDASLRQAMNDNSPAVRLAAVIALRKQRSPQLSSFLTDRDPRVVLEAARAIYDLPVERAMPQLAALVGKSSGSAPLLRRVVNANFRIGRDVNARALAKLATNPAALEAARVEALKALAEWAKPPGRDRVSGLWRPLPERDASVAAKAIGPILPELISSGPDPLKVAAAELAGKYMVASAAAALDRLVAARQASSSARVEALRALSLLDQARLANLVQTALSSGDEALRIEGIRLQAKQDPGAAAEHVTRRMKSGSVTEKQGSLIALGMIEHRFADPLIAEQLDQLLSGKLPPALQLELLEAADKRKAAEIRTRLDAFEKARPKTEIGKYVECLVGGNAEKGRKIFFEKTEVSCIRCHKVAGKGAEVGPDLSHSLTNRSREYLLESIVAPNKTIAPGYENVTIVLNNGASYIGIVKSETDAEVVLDSPEDGLVTLSKERIELRQRSLSGMQQGLAQALSKGELRDLVEFLATLK